MKLLNKLLLLFTVLLGSVSCYPIKDASKSNKEGFIYTEKDFNAWRALKIGDELSDVEAVLRPMFSKFSSKLGVKTLYYGSDGGFRKMEPSEYFYFNKEIFNKKFKEDGILSEDLPLFTLIFENSRLTKKMDPWGGISSLIQYTENGEKKFKELTSVNFIGEGIPSKPKIILPDSNDILDGKPYYLDIRWIPSQGTYPIKYEVQIAKLIKGNWSVRNRSTYDTMMSFIGGGKNKRRLRVRAVNSKGASEWSKYRYFEFTK